jgi:hypothetical protein
MSQFSGALLSPLRAASPNHRVWLQQSCASGGVRTCSTCASGPLQRPGDGAAMSATVPASVTAVLRGSGQGLAPDMRAFVEPRLGHDLSGVRVHADESAARSARDVNALAYTVGQDIVFGAGQYRPADPEGRRLITHELVHVVQQRQGGAAPAQEQALETEAEAAADLVAAGGRASIAGSSGLGVARVVGPQSLDHAVDPASMSNAELETEIGRIERWLQDNTSGPNSQKLAVSLGRLKEELARRPSVSASKPGGNSVNLRLRLPPVTSAEAAAGATAGPFSPQSINTPPPATRPGPTLDSMLPQQPNGRGPSPRPKPDPVKTTDTPAIPQATATPEVKKNEIEKPAIGVQTGTGEQTNLRLPHQAFGYAQVSVEWSNKFPSGLQFPQALDSIVKSVSLFGEPGLTLQVHALGDSQKQFDAQFLLKLVQLSFSHVDVSAVAGAGYNDVFNKPSWSRLAPLGGIEVEPKIGKLGPVEFTWVLDGLFTYSVPGALPGGPKNAPEPSRRPDGQFSGEARAKIEF